MSLFKRDKKDIFSQKESTLSELALKAIQDGVVMTDRSGVVKFINPAAIVMTGVRTSNNAVGLDCALIIKLESKEGRELADNENPLIQAIKTGQPLSAFQGILIVGQSDKRIPISLSVLPVEGLSQDRVITFRNITKEIEEEGEQADFISTASHEMRTPVATIDGYLSLALNPQTATIDERARGYLTAAEAASKHLGKLFQDLLDVTKIDDGRIRPHFVPTEMVGLVENIAKDYVESAKKAGLNFNFGSGGGFSFGEDHRIEQIAYGYVDPDFMREILDNLIENAIKYTPSGGSIFVNTRGDGDRVLISIKDTGIGISSEDLAHIFQKFYRVDNSDTREIGGTGLGLYLVKQRVEAMGGKIWAESTFGEGSVFYVSMPRLSSDEYEKRMIAIKNQEIQNQILANSNKTSPQGNPFFQPIRFPGQPAAQPAQPVAQPASPSVQPVQPPVQPIAQVTARPVSQPSIQPNSSGTTPPISSQPPGANPSLVPQNINNNLNGGLK